MKIAIVTGASSGIGREFVRRLDAKEELDEIWVIARRADRLEELKNVIKTHIISIPADLSDENGDELLQHMLVDKGPDVRILVNAAGYGKFGAVEDVKPSEQLGMVDLNITALMKITFDVLPYMHEGGKIFFVSSRSAFHPVPYITTYAATKSFVLSFSRGLGRELKNRKIRTLAVCPGWTRTEFFDRAADYGDVIIYYNKFVTAEQVVDCAFKDMKKGREISLCGFNTKWQVLAAKLMPHKWVMNIWCKQQRAVAKVDSSREKSRV